jgi:hypothetical protein
VKTNNTTSIPIIAGLLILNMIIPPYLLEYT